MYYFEHANNGILLNFYFKIFTNSFCLSVIDISSIFQNLSECKNILFQLYSIKSSLKPVYSRKQLQYLYKFHIFHLDVPVYI